MTKRISKIVFFIFFFLRVAQSQEAQSYSSIEFGFAWGWVKFNGIKQDASQSFGKNSFVSEASVALSNPFKKGNDWIASYTYPLQSGILVGISFRGSENASSAGYWISGPGNSQGFLSAAYRFEKFSALAVVGYKLSPPVLYPVTLKGTISGGTSVLDLEKDMDVIALTDFSQLTPPFYYYYSTHLRGDYRQYPFEFGVTVKVDVNITSYFSLSFNTGWTNSFAKTADGDYTNGSIRVTRSNDQYVSEIYHEMDLCNSEYFLELAINVKINN